MPTRTRAKSPGGEAYSVVINGQEIPYTVQRSAERKKTLGLTLRDWAQGNAHPREIEIEDGGLASALPDRLVRSPRSA